MMKTAIVTGATGAIGSAITRQMAERDFLVVAVARDERKAQRLISDIIQRTGNTQVRYEIVDLSCKARVFSFAERWEGPLHVLINNAAVTPQQRMETADGIELMFASNVLNYFWMTQAFHPLLKASAPARVVDVASYWAGGLNLDDLEFKKRPYSNSAAYRQSKQANRMLARAWADRLEVDGITINSCHPGDVNSRLSNNLGFGGSQSPDQGADTPVWLATEPAAGDKSGRYFANRKEDRCRFCDNQEAVDRLFEVCMDY